MAVLKQLTDEDIERAVRSVEPLNRAISERFSGKSGLKLIVWAGDLHLHQRGGYPFKIGQPYDYVDTSRQFEMCLHEINALELEPEAIVLGGDITDLGAAVEWEEFANIMSKGICRVRTLPVMGNHDNTISPIRDEIIKIWPEISQPGWPEITDPNGLYYSVIINGIKYVIIDTVIHSKSQRISDRMREWLEAELMGAELPTLIFQHVHMLPAGNWTDEGGAYRDKGILDAIHRSPHVLGAFAGHSHIPSLWQYRRKFYGTFPSVAYGIGGNTGWGGILVDGDKIVGVFRKDLPGESYDDCTGPMVQEGSFFFMEPKIFQRDPLLNPFFWYRETDHSLRD